MSKYGYTLVQHSDFVATGHAEFQFGLEPRGIATKAQLAVVERVGGLRYETYVEAEDAAEAYMYPSDAEGLIPQATGTFSFQPLDGSPIFIPPGGGS